MGQKWINPVRRVNPCALGLTEVGYNIIQHVLKSYEFKRALQGHGDNLPSLTPTHLVVRCNRNHYTWGPSWLMRLPCSGSFQIKKNRIQILHIVQQSSKLLHHSSSSEPSWGTATWRTKVVLLLGTNRSSWPLSRHFLSCWKKTSRFDLFQISVAYVLVHYSYIVLGLDNYIIIRSLSFWRGIKNRKLTLFGRNKIIF